LASHLDIGRAGSRITTYAANGISGVMPHPVLCRTETNFQSGLAIQDAA
jgi:hypothetical protein